MGLDRIILVACYSVEFCLLEGLQLPVPCSQRHIAAFVIKDYMTFFEIMVTSFIRHKSTICEWNFI